MKVRRGRVVLAMWVLVTWGTVQACGGVTNHGLSSEAECPWLNIGPDGEEHPAPMGPGDLCHTESDVTRTYDEQWTFQREARQDIVIGAWVLGVGAVGLGGLSVERRLQQARARRPYEARARRRRIVREARRP